MSSRRPLPRSLDPLPDESLTGFLLRLSHRLDLSLSRLAVLTGLVDKPGWPFAVTHVIELSADRLAAFAAATRLTQHEARGLTLTNLRQHYPPLNPSYRRERPDLPRGGANAGAGGWFSSATRYCPGCLAGDGSPIQSAHGGTWNKYWRLRTVFACPVHRQLLRHACPRCHLPPYQIPGHRTLPHSSVVLHPAQCRTTTDPAGPRTPHAHCGSHLDRDTADADAPATDTMQELLRVQDAIFSRLGVHPDPVRHGTDDSMAWFHDLQLLVGLIRVCWPAAASLAPSWIDLDAIGDHLDRHEHAATQARQAGKKITTPWGLPGDARTSASLLALADVVLTGGGDRPDRDHVDLLCSAAGDHPAWTRLINAILPGGSPALQAALATHTDRHRPRRRHGLPRVLRGVPLPPLTPPAHIIQPRHLAHRLPDHVVAPLLNLDTAFPARDAHRYLAIRLMQGALDCDMITAADRLELPMDAAQPSCWRVIRWADQHDRHADLATATNQAVDAFARSAHAIDYQNRRHHLREWAIPPKLWNSTVAPLRDGWPFRRCRDLDDQKRLITSVFIWRDITAGDHTACPIYFTRARLDDAVSTKFTWNVAATVRNYDLATAESPTSGKGNYMRRLMRAFHDYRQQLAHDVDALGSDQLAARVGLTATPSART